MNRKQELFHNIQLLLSAQSVLTMKQNTEHESTTRFMERVKASIELSKEIDRMVQEYENTPWP